MINKIDNVTSVSGNIKTQKENNPFNKLSQETHYLDSDKKVSFGESIKLFAKGFGKQVKDMFLGIIKHPIKTIATIGLTTAGLLALPLIGIPTAVGGAALAIGFGAIGGIKLVKNTVKGIKNNRNGNYQLARDCFEKAGSAGVDVALSAPFIPKGIKTIKEFAKYGKIGINSALITELKSADGIKNKINAFKNANTEFRRNYDYQQLVDNQIAEMKTFGLDEEFLIKAKKELLRFNVPKEQIPQVVMDTMVEYYGIKGVKVPVEYAQTTGSNNAYFDPAKAKIILKDRTLPDLPESTAISTSGKRVLTGKQIKSGKLSADNTTIDFVLEDRVTGEISHETIPKRIYEIYLKLRNPDSNISPVGREILTTVHEGTHWWQRAQINLVDGSLLRHPAVTPFAKDMYLKMLEQMERPLPGTPQFHEATSYARAYRNYTKYCDNFIRYLKNEMEVGARERQYAVMMSDEFKTLDHLLKQIKDPEQFKFANTVLPSVVQAHNAVS